MIERVIGRTATAALALSLCALPAAAQKKAQNAAAAPAQLDLDKPDDAFKAFRKLQVSLSDGKPTTIWFQGSTYSRVAGERDRLLFKWQAMNIRQAKTVEEPGKGYGYRMVSRELVIYLDPQTGEVLRSWKNPFTGKEVEVVHVANDPVNQAPAFAQGARGPFKFPATVKEGRGSLSFEVPLFYTNVMGGDYQDYVGGTYHAQEQFHFFFDMKELLGPGDYCQTSVAWGRVSQWLPWMEMGSRAGWLLFSGSGQTVSSFDQMPEVLKQEIETNYPEYKTPPPLDDARPNETSWTVFKKKLDQKRKGATPQK